MLREANVRAETHSGLSCQPFTVNKVVLSIGDQMLHGCYERLLIYLRTITSLAHRLPVHAQRVTQRVGHQVATRRVAINLLAGHTNVAQDHRHTHTQCLHGHQGAALKESIEDETIRSREEFARRGYVIAQVDPIAAGQAFT